MERGAHLKSLSKESVKLREKTKRKRFLDGVDESKVYKFDMTGKLSRVYPNIHIAVEAMKLNGNTSKTAIRRCASEKDLNHIKYEGWYWSFKKEIPEKCYIKGEFIHWNQKKKPRRKRKQATPQEKLEKLWKS